MTTSRLAAVCDPTQWVQSLIAINVHVNQETHRYTITKKFFQGGLSTVTAVTCIPACATEIVKLVGDISCKGTGGAIRGVQYITNPEWLESFYQIVSHRPSLSHRVERIVGQAFGLFISACGTFFLLVLRDDWTIQQHQSLGNYIPSIPKPASANSAEKESVPPTGNPTETVSTATPKLKPPPVPPREKKEDDPASTQASASETAPPAVDAPEASSSAPPPPPLPPTASSSAPPSAPPRPANPTPPAVAKEAGKTFLEEIAAKGGKDRKAFTFKKGAIKSSSTMQKNLSGAIDRQMKPLRIQSECVTFSGIAVGYTVKGRTTLREAAEAMDIDFPVEEEKELDGKLANYIQDLSPPGPLTIGAVIEMQNEDYPNRSFTIQITKVEENVVVEATIKYLMLNQSE